MENYTKRVPKEIRKVVAIICKRYVITGICDAAYIANTIGVINEIGDGQGTFWGNKITRPEETADALMHAYGCNIFAGDRSELVLILKDMKLARKEMIAGLKRYIEFCEKKKEVSDEYYINYLNRSIAEANKILIA